MARPKIPKTNKGWYGPFYHGTSVESANKILKSGYLSVVGKTARKGLLNFADYMDSKSVLAVHYASFYTKKADKPGNIMRQSNWGKFKDDRNTNDDKYSAVIVFFTKIKPHLAKIDSEDADAQTVVFSELDLPIEIYKIYYFKEEKIQPISKFMT